MVLPLWGTEKENEKLRGSGRASYEPGSCVVMPVVGPMCHIGWGVRRGRSWARGSWGTEKGEVERQRSSSDTCKTQEMLPFFFCPPPPASSCLCFCPFRFSFFVQLIVCFQIFFAEVGGVGGLEGVCWHSCTVCSALDWAPWPPSISPFHPPHLSLSLP